MFDFGQQLTQFLQFGDPYFLHLFSTALLPRSAMAGGGSSGIVARAMNGAYESSVRSFPLISAPSSSLSQTLSSPQSNMGLDICKLLEVFSSCILKVGGYGGVCDGGGCGGKLPAGAHSRASSRTTVWPPVAAAITTHTPTRIAASNQPPGWQNAQRKRPLSPQDEALDDGDKEPEEAGGLRTPALNSLIEMTLSEAYQMSAAVDGSMLTPTPQQLSGTRVDRQGGPNASIDLRSPKRRKTRTTFTSFQLSELEVYFSKQKYLSPADRDQIAGELGLSSTQVITWFQNRRAKKKRERAELERDILATKQNREKSQPFLFNLPRTIDLSNGLNPSNISPSQTPSLVPRTHGRWVSSVSCVNTSPTTSVLMTPSDGSKFSGIQRRSKPLIWRPILLEDGECIDEGTVGNGSSLTFQ